MYDLGHALLIIVGTFSGVFGLLFVMARMEPRAGKDRACVPRTIRSQRKQ